MTTHREQFSVTDLCRDHLALIDQLFPEANCLVDAERKPADVEALRPGHDLLRDAEYMVVLYEVRNNGINRNVKERYVASLMATTSMEASIGTRRSARIALFPTF